MTPITADTRDAPVLAPLTAAHSDPVAPPFVSLCKWCGRITPFTRADMTRYAREGWPLCCNHPMLCSTPDAPGHKRYGYPKEWAVRNAPLEALVPPDAVVMSSSRGVGPSNACDWPTLVYGIEIKWPGR